MTSPGFTDPPTWYAQLPTCYTAAGMLITDVAGRVLVVKPNYRDHWTVPGGVVEPDEPPHLAGVREVREELGLDIPAGPLLVVDWAPPDHERPRPILYFLFDGGGLADPTAIRLQADELDEHAFLPPAEAAARLAPPTAPRIAAALAARSCGRPAYLPAGRPVSPPASRA